MHPQLLAVISKWLTNTSMIYDGIKVSTNQGVQQGAILSPTLYLLFIDDLITKLYSSTSKIYAYADEIAILTEENAAHL